MNFLGVVNLDFDLDFEVRVGVDRGLGFYFGARAFGVGDFVGGLGMGRVFFEETFDSILLLWLGDLSLDLRLTSEPTVFNF